MSADKYPSIFSRQMEAIVYIFPNFQNCARCVKDLKDNKDNSLHLAQKYARIFVPGHYLLLVAHSFPRATLSENCSLFGTDNVREKYPSIFSRQMQAIVYIYRTSRFLSSTACIHWIKAFESLYGGQFTLSTQLITPNYLNLDTTFQLI